MLKTNEAKHKNVETSFMKSLKKCGRMVKQINKYALIKNVNPSMKKQNHYPFFSL
jgi:hypothetical protein